MHVYPFPQTDEWESQWFFFDVQLHPYQLHFRRRVEDGDESAVGRWEDSYAKLAQVRGQMCVQPYVASLCTTPAETSHPTWVGVLFTTKLGHELTGPPSRMAMRTLSFAEGRFPTIAPRASFHGPVDTTAFRFKPGSLSSNQLKCCGFIQYRTYLPPRDREPTVKGGQVFHILVYMPHDQQPWKSRIDWMKSSPEGGFASRKWIYGRGSIVGVLNPTLLEKEPQPGQDLLVILADEFGFTSRATFESGTAMRNESSPQKAKTESGKRRNPFSSSPDASPSKRTRDPTFGRGANERGVEPVDGESSAITTELETESTGWCS